MLIHQDHCPNCHKRYCFPVQFPGERFRVICPHCSVGFDLQPVEADAELEHLLQTRSQASFIRRPGLTRRLYGYLVERTRRIQFSPPSEPFLAIVFRVALNPGPLPLAVYFQDAYHLVRPVSRLLFAGTFWIASILFLLTFRFPLIQVLVAATIVTPILYLKTARPKIKGAARQRLLAEQTLLKHCYELQQTLIQIYQARQKHQTLLERQEAHLEQMLLTPSSYPTQTELYRGSIHCTQDYLNLCDQAIAQYEAAIRELEIQIENSRLSGELPTALEDSHWKSNLDRLKAQLANYTSKPSDNEPGNHYTT